MEEKRIAVPQNIKKSVKLVSMTLNEGLSLYAYPISVSKTRDIPKQIHTWLDAFIKSKPNLEVFGSLAMQSYAPHGRTPGDLDAIVDNPEHVAMVIASELNRYGFNAKCAPHQWKGGWQVSYLKNGVQTTIADLHPKNNHNVQYAQYGFTKKPSKVQGVLIQESEDQLLRKANEIMRQDGVGGHRIAKDLEDFVVIANTMLDSKVLRAQAKLEKVKQAKKELAKIVTYAKSVKGIDAQARKRMIKDPIPATLEKRVITYAKAHPEIDVRDIVKLPNMISHTTRVPKRNPPELASTYPPVAQTTGQKISSNKKDTRKWSAIPGMFSWKI